MTLPEPPAAQRPLIFRPLLTNALSLTLPGASRRVTGGGVAGAGGAIAAAAGQVSEPWAWPWSSRPESPSGLASTSVSWRSGRQRSRPSGCALRSRTCRRPGCRTRILLTSQVPADTWAMAAPPHTPAPRFALHEVGAGVLKRTLWGSWPSACENRKPTVSPARMVTSWSSRLLLAASWNHRYGFSDPSRATRNAVGAGGASDLPHASEGMNTATTSALTTHGRPLRRRFTERLPRLEGAAHRERVCAFRMGGSRGRSGSHRKRPAVDLQAIGAQRRPRSASLLQADIDLLQSAARTRPVVMARDGSRRDWLRLRWPRARPRHRPPWMTTDAVPPVRESPTAGAACCRRLAS